MPTTVDTTYFRRAYSGNTRSALASRAFNDMGAGGVRRASGKG